MSAKPMPKLIGMMSPRTLLGWSARFFLILALIWWGNSFVYPLIHNGANASFTTLAVNTGLFAVPIAGVLLWSLAAVSKDHRRLEKVYGIDPVTGLPNRNSFCHQLQPILPQSGVLLLIDIDDFRTINDRRGRQAGDLCMMSLAQRFRELTRETDIVGRMDGPTFAAYLPGATVEHAYGVAARLTDGVQLIRESGVMKFTTSVGAVFADGEMPIADLLRGAEAALERAKLNGRATVVLDALPMVA
ncbi:GGDEF domain-containing protein [Yoonia sediminilitoris]|uniref:diguanylate cyclase n=1 Tax=Yoonia sediminilitoris TaxID=1286148 RepID=A0A2T6KS12_9RHOB|nr:GGDEF domain-containing protein [Yoonia sediminilitoris]PUB19339.1 diguanylate cyclase (GGDEF)-like protein [Yoonia sediminilitoris]RCW99507.1 diguanylate cyclase (GGDEF)-like protein [Yoonia sediminilitoris]